MIRRTWWQCCNGFISQIKQSTKISDTSFSCICSADYLLKCTFKFDLFYDQNLWTSRKVRSSILATRQAYQMEISSGFSLFPLLKSQVFRISRRFLFKLIKKFCRKYRTKLNFKTNKNYWFTVHANIFETV